MTDERKKDLGFKLQNIISELADIVKETHIGISLMTLYNHNDDYTFNCNYLHYDDGRLVDLQDDEVKDAFFIERDDKIKEENEDGKENTEE